MSNHNKYIFRKAILKDIDDILNIEKIAYGKHHWSKDVFTKEFKNQYSTYFVCEYNTDKPKVIGYIGYWQIEDEGHITTLAISNSYKRKHVADKLLYILMNDARSKDIKWLTLEVRLSNLPAINLYKKYNFKQLGIRKKYYQDNNEDALILWTENLNDDKYRSINEPELTLS